MKNIFWNKEVEEVSVFGFMCLMLSFAIIVLSLVVIFGRQNNYESARAACGGYRGYSTRWYDHGYLDYGCQVKALNGQWETLREER